MTTQHHRVNFNATASGMYLRQAEAALSLIQQPRHEAKADGVTHVRLGRCTLYRVAASVWQRRREGKAP